MTGAGSLLTSAGCSCLGEGGAISTGVEIASGTSGAGAAFFAAGAFFFFGAAVVAAARRGARFLAGACSSSVDLSVGSVIKKVEGGSAVRAGGAFKDAPGIGCNLNG